MTEARGGKGKSKSNRLIFSVGSRGFDHSEEVCVGGVAAALVAGGEDEPAAFGGIVNRFFARGDYVIG